MAQRFTRDGDHPCDCLEKGGGGCTEASIMAMYSIVAADTLRKGGLDLDEAIVSYVRRKYGIVIGQLTAEQLKFKIGAAVPQDTENTLEVQGQDQVTGLPRPVTLTTGEIVEALQDPLKEVTETCRRVLERTPPELVADIIDRGVALCGGGALLRGVDKLLTKSLGHSGLPGGQSHDMRRRGRRARTGHDEHPAPESAAGLAVAA